MTAAWSGPPSGAGLDHEDHPQVQIIMPSTSKKFLLRPLGTLAVVAVLIVAGLPGIARAADGGSPETFRRQALGSSLFVLANVIPTDDAPHFYQVNYQYRVTKRDVLSVEAITWHYYAPLGIPYGKSWGDRNENYPGFVRALGVALAYKRFLYQGLYTALHAANMHQSYVAENGSTIQTGYQLFVTWRIGYHIEFFDERFFLEPSVAMTAWPINTNLPASFRAREEEWPNYFLGEPGLHFGFHF